MIIELPETQGHRMKSTGIREGYNVCPRRTNPSAAIDKATGQPETGGFHAVVDSAPIQ